MKNISVISVLLGAILSVSGTLSAQEPLDASKMSEPALLAKARQLVQEEFELSKVAVGKAGSERVKQFAERVAKHGQELDAALTERAAAAGVTEPRKISEPMQQRLTAIEKLKGTAFDPDYLDMLIDMQGTNILVLEELAKRAGDAKLRELAREAAAAERTHRAAAQKLVARDTPDTPAK